MSSQANTASEEGSLHLRYLDGLRGLTALWVLGFHVVCILCGLPDRLKLGWLAELSPFWIWTGHQAVGVFIVLSGYCLMLPVARTGRLPGGLRGFAVRRVRRILPPYYAALGLCVLLYLTVPGLNSGLGLPENARHALAPRSILAHLLLIQNWTRWAQTLDGPMWSVATEWQIYSLFGLILLPLWCRVGPLATLLTASVLGLGVLKVMHRDFTWVCPQYLLLFTLGMLAASVSFGRNTGGVIRLLQAKGMPWGLITALLLVLAWAGGYSWTSSGNRVALADVLIGAATASLLVMAVACPWSLAVRALSWRPLVGLGGFSYSLYLLHIPLLDACQASLLSAHASRAGLLAGVMMCFPLSLVLAYLFHLAFERPFLSSRRPAADRGRKRPCRSPLLRRKHKVA